MPRHPPTPEPPSHRPSSTSHDPAPRLVVGCMTGTSLDALDVALVSITGQGLAIEATPLHTVSHPLPDSLRSRLRAMADGRPMAPIQVLGAARALGQLHAEAVGDLLAQANPDPPLAFVVAHGQTVWHAGGEHLSWQLFDPWPIVRRLGVSVCHDLRQADLIAGGEGAPITPIADWVLYRGQADAVVNLGGICNLTRLGQQPEDIEARDVCPCNLLLDAVVQRLKPGVGYDKDGRFAATGRASDPEPFAALLASRRRSMGREDLDPQRLAAVVDRFERGADAAASAVEAVGQAIGAALEPGESIVLAGGGARHPGLVAAIARHGGAVIRLSDETGLACEAREAVAFAVLGALSRDGVAITLPQITGAEQPGLAGVWAYA